MPTNIMILGPTASGKSAAAMLLAERCPIEIISVDSAQVYRTMNVGTAKPNALERSTVTHHLIDIVDPINSYSAAQFATDTRALLTDIRQRGKVPVLVGGTMLYVKALVDGLNNLPSANPTLRAELDRQADDIGWPAMHQRLRTLDPITADRLEPNDSQRVQRALEVIQLTGKPMSVLLAQEPDKPVNSEQFLAISLEPSDRSVLHANIARRFNQMIDDGFVEEVHALRTRGDLHLGLPSMRCVGYRQIWQWFENGAVKNELNHAVDAGIAATRQLAKRQLTWLRANNERIIVDSNIFDSAAQVAAIAQRELT